MLLGFSFFNESLHISQAKNHRTIATTMFRGYIPNTLTMLLYLNAPTHITTVKIMCMVTSLTFELELLVSCKETHIPVTNSLVIIASFLGIKNFGK
jgi:hypothetical protein